MPRIELISSDEDDDIWDYRSQTQKARREQNDTKSKGFARGEQPGKRSKSSGSSRSSLSQKHIKTEDGGSIKMDKSQKQRKASQKKRTKVKLEVKREQTPNAKHDVDRSGRCPVCQMPFALLSMIETTSWHVDQCLDVPYSSKNECPAGLECDSEFTSHYKKFRHTRLARSRRKNEIADRNTGNVDSARTKLSFDAGNHDKTKLVVPGSSADCVIDLDSSQDSAYSERANDNVIDEDLPSPNCEIGFQKEHNIYRASRLKKNLEVVNSRLEKHDNLKQKYTNEKRIMPEKVKGKENVLDKNKNFIDKNSKQHLENDLFGTCTAKEIHSEEAVFEDADDDDVEEINLFGERADMSAGLTRVETIDLSDDSCGSVQDINDLVDETRSLTDMINDAQAQDDVTAAESSEVESDKSEDSEKYNVRSRAKLVVKYVNDNAENDTDDEVENQDDDNDDEDEDDLISLFTSSSKKNTADKKSAITELRKTPAKSTDSNSSSDWEILRTTLTQPSFELDKKRKDIDTKSILAEHSSQMFKESLKTPTKASKIVQSKQDKEPKGYVETSNSKSSEKHKSPRIGFFATKLLQNVNKSKPVKGSRDSVSLCEDTEDNSDESNEVKKKIIQDKENMRKLSSKFENKHSKIEVSQLKKNTASNTETDKIKGCDDDDDDDDDIAVYKHTSFKRKPDCATKADTYGKIRSPKSKHSTPHKDDVKTEPVEKKPKIELKPKTPTKRKLSKRGQKGQQKVKTEAEDSKYPKLESFFKVKDELKSIPISIQTDSESSGDCERFNKIGNFVKCCAKCTEAKSCSSNYIHSMNDKINISNRGDNNSELVDKDKVNSGNMASCSAKPSQDSCKSISDSFPVSEATSCRGCESSQNSINFTISRSCQSCSQVPDDKKHKNSTISTYQECSNKSQGQHSKSHGPISSIQNSSFCCSCSQHSQSSRIQERSTCKSQNSSLNNSSSSTSSQSTLQFNIQNVCTLSQNTYGNMGGGFIIENDDGNANLVRNPQRVNDSNSHTPCASSSVQNIESSSSVSDRDVQSILQIRKSATDILMASSRLLYGKTSKNSSSKGEGRDYSNSPVMSTSSSNFGNSARGVTFPSAAKKPMETLSQRGRGWNRNRGSTSTEMSDDTNDTKRKCPFYKKIPDTSMTVDAFRYGNIPDCRAYILSHFHYDHYMGLTKKFKNPIYCSKITGNLVKKKIGVDSQYICTIPLYTPTSVENVEITFLEANHCPGAVLILFKLKSGKVYLHTGDFRASQAMETYPPLQNLRIHSLYLDTTYCDPQYDFPPQEEVIQFTVQLVLDALTNNPKTLIVCGTYTIGKERIFTAIAEELDCKICVTRDKKNVLDCMEDEKLRQRISLKWEDSGLHVVPMNKINYNGLQEHLLLNGKKYNSVLGIEPTGWTHSKKILSLYHIKPKLNKDNIKIYGVPYSEHSSFLELKRFVQFTKPAKILPTVNNGNVHSRKKMEVIFEAWMEDLRNDRAPVSRQSNITGWTK